MVVNLSFSLDAFPKVEPNLLVLVNDIEEPTRAEAHNGVHEEDVLQECVKVYGCREDEEDEARCPLYRIFVFHGLVNGVGLSKGGKPCTLRKHV